MKPGKMQRGGCTRSYGAQEHNLDCQPNWAGGKSLGGSPRHVRRLAEGRL